MQSHIPRPASRFAPLPAAALAPFRTASGAAPTSCRRCRCWLGPTCLSTRRASRAGRSATTRVRGSRGACAAALSPANRCWLVGVGSRRTRSPHAHASHRSCNSERCLRPQTLLRPYTSHIMAVSGARHPSSAACAAWTLPHGASSSASLATIFALPLLAPAPPCVARAALQVAHVPARAAMLRRSNPPLLWVPARRRTLQFGAAAG